MIRLADAAAPKETGGTLLGYWTTAGDDVVVTNITGPGPGAIHENHRFVPDYDYQDREIVAIYAASGRHHAYLGDWHTHPNGGTGLSRQDRCTLRRIAAHAPARAPCPLMAVLGERSEWNLKIWAYLPRNIRAWRPLARTITAKTRLFE